MSAANEHGSGSVAVMTRQKILVINDSPDFLIFMREFLTVEGGYEVATYDQSEAVLDQVTNHPPDLIILDIVFRHGRSGFEVANELAAAADTAGIPLLFCTALSEREIAADIRELAASRGQRILYKPFDVDVLLQIVTDMLPGDSDVESGSA